MLLSQHAFPVQFLFFFFALQSHIWLFVLWKRRRKKKKNSSESRVQHGRKGAKRAAANNVFYITILTYCSAGGILSSICQRVFQRLSPSVPPLFFFLNIPLRGGLLVLASRLFLLLFFFFCLFVSYSCVLLLCCVMACFSLFVSFRYFPIVFFFLFPLSWWTRCQKRRTMWARRTENHVTINPDELCSRNYQTTQFNNKTQTSVVLTTTTISLACTSMSVRVYSYTAFKGDPACRSKMLFAVRLRGTLASSNWPVLRSESEITKELWRFSVFEKEKR